jgi:hypothetical protein
MQENTKIELLIYAIKSQLLVVNDSELIVYKTLKSILDLAEAIKNQKI